MSSRLEEFKKKFQGRLFSVGNIRVSRENVSKHFRRLDSIARLIEGGSICAAVYYHHPSQTLWIANNKVHKSSRKNNNEIERIKKVFTLISETRASIEEIVECLAEVVYRHISQEKRFEKAKLDDIKIKDKIESWMKEMFLSGKTTKQWKLACLEEDEDVSENKSVGFVVKKTARIIRDFIKVRDFLLKNRGNHAVASGILDAIKNNRFQIIHFEGKDVHAEMRLLSKKIAMGSQPGEDHYFGISKLCCNHCALAMQAFNVPSRGVHGQGAKWMMPKFIMESEVNRKKFLGDAHPLWSQLTDDEKKEAKDFMESKAASPVKGNAKTGRDMYADSSSSDLEFGVRLSDEEEEEQIQEFSLQQVWQVKEMRELYKTECEQLLSIGLDLREITALYSAPRSKFTDLTDQSVWDFLEEASQRQDFHSTSKKEIFDTLLSIYDDDEELFANVLSTSEDLLRHHGFEEIVTRLTRTLVAKRQKRQDASLTDSSSDAHASLQEEYSQDRGWDYDENSDDSQNRWIYKDSSSSHSRFHRDSTSTQDTESETYDNADSEAEESSDETITSSLSV